MTFQDIFKSSFLENVTAVSLLDMAIAWPWLLRWGCLSSLCIRNLQRGHVFFHLWGDPHRPDHDRHPGDPGGHQQRGAEPGHGGRLSIVRFRSAIKDPLDIAFLFWAIGAGIVLAAGLIPLGVIGSLLIGAVLLLFVNHKSNDQPIWR